MTRKPIRGWYVRVTTTDIVHGEPVTILYLAGYFLPEEVEEAVRQARAINGETYKAVVTVVEGQGPQPDAGEVRELAGAV
jgi:hypothetical protein